MSENVETPIDYNSRSDTGPAFVVNEDVILDVEPPSFVATIKNSYTAFVVKELKTRGM